MILKFFEEWANCWCWESNPRTTVRKIISYRCTIWILCRCDSESSNIYYTYYNFFLNLDPTKTWALGVGPGRPRPWPALESTQPGIGWSSENIVLFLLWTLCEGPTTVEATELLWKILFWCQIIYISWSFG